MEPPVNGGKIVFQFQRMAGMKYISIRLLLLLPVLAAGTLPAVAQPVPHLTTVQPGGLPGIPVMGGLTKLTNGVQINWDGPSGYYQVFQASNSLTAPWIALGKATNLACTATISQLYKSAFFKVSGPAPNYVGSKACNACHSGVCQYETNTAHASAFSSPAFQALGGQSNPSCLPCHTVGYGLPTGFTNATKTPLLEGVQCENCHGPAGNHAASEDDPTIRPRVEVAATLCGGCHSASHTSYTNPPTYEQWSGSGHGTVVPDALQAMSENTNNLESCGACHSGAARLALISGQYPLTNDYNLSLGCAVCHNPHQTNSVSLAQLRNPLSSTNDFHLTSTNLASLGAFTNQYNASTNINLCAQCHNDRGAAWTDTARAPHHSVQYNFLMGSVGALPTGYGTFNPGAHSGLPTAGTFYLTNQCSDCHMSSIDAVGGGHDHSLAINYNVCNNCHNGPEAQAFLTPYLSNQVSTVITILNRWAAAEAPAAIVTNGVVPWEYTTPGGLTWTTNSAGFVTSWSLSAPVNFAGPATAGQALIPDSIKQARYNLYVFLNDGSFGAHNPIYAITLLNAALEQAGP